MFSRRSKEPKKPKTKQESLIELVVIVAVAVGLALLIQAFIVKPYRIPSPSMEPTLAVGQRVLVNRIGQNFSEPHVGQIVVFKPPVGAESGSCGVSPRPLQQPCPQATRTKSKENFIKRIVAGPGDTISVRFGRVILNGKLQQEDFIRPADSCQHGAFDPCNLPKELRIPKGHYFMMGDNRGNSDDGRFWGPVPKGWIIGNAFATYWPPKRIGIF